MRQIELRPANINDAALLASWGIGCESYQRASLIKELARVDIEMFICEAGWAQIDHLAEYDELRWVVAPHLRNRGYGKAIARMLKAKTKRPIIATIQEDNYASIKIAQSIGAQIKLKSNAVDTIR